MRIRVNSKWQCIDPNLEQYGGIGTVNYVNDEPGLNGEGEVEIIHDNGETYTMKVRKFLFRYEELNKF